MGQSRNSWYARQLRKERARQDVWGESLGVVVKGENLEQELRKRRENGHSRKVLLPNILDWWRGPVVECSRRRIHG